MQCYRCTGFGHKETSCVSTRTWKGERITAKCKQNNVPMRKTTIHTSCNLYCFKLAMTSRLILPSALSNFTHKSNPAEYRPIHMDAKKGTDAQAQQE